MIGDGFMDKEQAALDKFGQRLVEQARDYAIREADNTLNGRTKGTSSRRFYERVRASSLSPEQIAVIRDFIPEIVDTTLHHLLWTVLGQTNWLALAVATDHGIVPDLEEVSDGLEGEYCMWVPRFSSERFNPDLFNADIVEEEFGVTFSRVSPGCIQRDPAPDESER
jgi:hypothetical protein